MDRFEDAEDAGGPEDPLDPEDLAEVNDLFDAYAAIDEIDAWLDARRAARTQRGGSPLERLCGAMDQPLVDGEDDGDEPQVAPQRSAE